MFFVAIFFNILHVAHIFCRTVFVKHQSKKKYSIIKTNFQLDTNEKKRFSDESTCRLILLHHIP